MGLQTQGGTLLARQISRRSLLRGSAAVSGGFALFLMGCSSDDDGGAPATAVVPTAASDDEPTSEPTSEATPEPATDATTEATGEPTADATLAPIEAMPSKVVVQSVKLAGDDGVVVLKNLSDAAVDLGGWFVCQRPAYWGIPALTLEPGAEVRLHAGAGEDGDGDLFAGGGFGSLDGGSGEIGLYRDRSFGSADAIVSFVAWNGSNGRTSVARDAGIWGAEDLAASDGATLVFVGPSEDPSGWSVQ